MNLMMISFALLFIHRSVRVRLVSTSVKKLEKALKKELNYRAVKIIMDIL